MTALPPVPPQAIKAAADAITRELMSGKDYSMWMDSDEALAVAALEAGQVAIREDERQRVYAELGNDHFVIFTADRWTIEHSVACRLGGRMHECAVHRAVAETFCTPDPDQFGRWRVTGIDSEGLPDLERADLPGGAR